MSRQSREEDFPEVLTLERRPCLQGRRSPNEISQPLRLLDRKGGNVFKRDPKIITRREHFEPRANSRI